MKGFKYQITVKGFLSKEGKNKDIEYRPIYFNFAT